MATEKLAPALSAAGFQQEEPVAAVVYQLSGARLKEAMLKTRRKR
jgi:ribosomal protein L12E/L44/L45/RPP1/RPP2